jgi:hypothetical protein
MTTTATELSPRLVEFLKGVKKLGSSPNFVI